MEAKRQDLGRIGQRSLLGTLVSGLEKWATRGRLWQLLVLALALLATFKYYVNPGIKMRMTSFQPGAEITLDARHSYTQEEARALLNTYTQEAKDFYKAIEYTIDLLFPLTYGLLSTLLIVYVVRESFGGRRWLWLLMLPALGVMLLDLSENVCVIAMLSGEDHQIVGWAERASIITFAKWKLVLVALPIGVLVWVTHLIVHYRKTGRREGPEVNGQL